MKEKLHAYLFMLLIVGFEVSLLCFNRLPTAQQLLTKVLDLNFYWTTYVENLRAVFACQFWIKAVIM